LGIGHSRGTTGLALLSPSGSVRPGTFTDSLPPHSESGATLFAAVTSRIATTIGMCLLDLNGHRVGVRPNGNPGVGETCSGELLGRPVAVKPREGPSPR